MANKREIANAWIALMKPGTRAGQNEKLLKLYTDFLYSWLALIFLGKYKTVGDERTMLKNLVVNAPEPLISKIYTATSHNISEIAKLRVKNEDLRRVNICFEEADKLDVALSGANPRQIIEATLGLLYVVRCNLFHADKSPSDTRDTDIMFYSSKITANISETMVKELP